MSGRPAGRWPTRGVVWHEFGVGEGVEQPLAERAYRTPRFPQAIRGSDLRKASEQVQRETALFWFWSNLKPYDLSDGYYFSFDTPGQGFDQAPFAPSPISASDAIDSEFMGILSESLRHNLGETLSGGWMWIEGDIAPTSISDLHTSTDLQNTILTGLDDLAAAVRQLAPGHGRMGHNGPPDELPLTSQEQDEALDAIEQVKTGLAAGGTDGALLVRAGWAHFAHVSGKLGNWALEHSSTDSTQEACAARA